MQFCERVAGYETSVWKNCGPLSVRRRRFPVGRKRRGRGFADRTEGLDELVHRAQVLDVGVTQAPRRHAGARSERTRVGNPLRLAHLVHVDSYVGRISRAPGAAVPDVPAGEPVFLRSLACTLLIA